MTTENEELEPLSDSESYLLLRDLRKEVALCRRLARYMKYVSFPGTLAFITLQIYGFAVMNEHPLPHTFFMVWLFKIMLVSMVCVVPLSFLASKQSKRLAALIEPLSYDLRAIGPLAQPCHSKQDKSISKLALSALCKLLPRLKPGDGRYLDDDQMDALLGLLFVRKQPLFVSQNFASLPWYVLKALEQIGASRAIGPVRLLTQGYFNRKFQQAAKQCLTQLEAHGEEREQTRLLLIPSAETAGRDTLLRAASGIGETKPEQLLRAAIGEGER